MQQVGFVSNVHELFEAVAEGNFFPVISEFPWKEVLGYSSCDSGNRRGSGERGLREEET